MTITRNECCDCAVPAYPCLGKHCPLRNKKVHICDDCKDEVDELYEFGIEEICSNCIEKRLQGIE